VKKTYPGPSKKRFFCIGGPFHLQQKTWEEASQHKYYQYNRAGAWSDEKRAPLASIFVYFQGMTGQ
jgi:hypothetical protein